MVRNSVVCIHCGIDLILNVSTATGSARKPHFEACRNQFIVKKKQQQKKTILKAATDMMTKNGLHGNITEVFERPIDQTVCQ